ncbi:polysaccharide biosynthesis tyrosine autokinase [Planctomycetota bacterium]
MEINAKHTNESGNINIIPATDKTGRKDSFLEIALRHRWIILSTTILFLVAAFIYLLRATPIYTSASRLYVEQRGPKIISDYEGIVPRSKNYLYTQCEMMKSTPIVSDAIEDDAQISSFKTFSNIDNVVAYTKKSLDVSVGQRDDIITVSFDSAYPQEAALIVNTVVNSYIEYHATRKRSTVSEVLRIVQNEKVNRDRELTEKFEQMLQFTKENGVVSFDNKNGNVVFQRLAKLSEFLTEAQLATINARANYEAVKSMENEPARVMQYAIAQPDADVSRFVNPEETLLRKELRELQLKLQNAKSQCTEKHPFVIELQDNIKDIKEKLNQQAMEFSRSYNEVMRLRWKTAKQREDELLASFEAERQKAQHISVKAAEYSALQSELKRNERLCEILDDRIKELNVTEDTGALNISILEVARAGDKPAKPQKASVMSIALVLGLVFGCGFALLRDLLDYRLHSVEEVSAVLSIPVIGLVPKMSGAKTVAEHSHRAWMDFRFIITDVYRKIRGAVISDIPKRKTGTIGVASAITDNSEITSAEQDSSISENGLPLKLKSMVGKVSGMLNTTASSGKAGSETNTVDETSSRAAHNEARFKERTGVNHRHKEQLESVFAVDENYKTRFDAALFGASKKGAETIGTAFPSDESAGLRNTVFVDHGQEVLLKPMSVVAEAYRTIRTAVFFGVPKGKAKTIVVTSPAPGDGKTTLVSNLAIAMAQAGQKILILDCDFRKPRQHNIFQIDGAKGITGVFAGSITLDEAICNGPVEGLDIMPRGPEVPNPSEVLNSEAFVGILGELCRRYDRIIVDSPPVSAVADSRILGAICDITLLVLRAEKSTRKHSQQAVQGLLSIGAKVLGAIVNDVPLSSRRYGYYSGYGYYGRYGYHEHYNNGCKSEKKEYQPTTESVVENVAIDNISSNKVRT